MPVWAVAGAYKVEQGKADNVTAAYHLSREQVDAAFAYYTRYGDLIDKRLPKKSTLWRPSISTKMCQVGEWTATAGWQ